jgi:hypothetical protein
MTSTKSSDYEALGGGGDGGGGGSRPSRLLARGPPPGGKEKEDNNSTPIAFDVNDGNSGKVEVNGECKGNGNIDGPVDNNEDNDYNVNNHDNDDDDVGVGGQKCKCGTIVEQWEEMKVEEEKGEEAECVTFLSRKSKLGMNEVALFEYINTRLEEMTECLNKWCTCLAILGDASAHASVTKYLTWFEQKNK